MTSGSHHMAYGKLHAVTAVHVHRLLRVCLLGLKMLLNVFFELESKFLPVAPRSPGQPLNRFANNLASLNRSDAGQLAMNSWAKGSRWHMHHQGSKFMMDVSPWASCSSNSSGQHMNQHTTISNTYSQ